MFKLCVYQIFYDAGLYIYVKYAGTYQRDYPVIPCGLTNGRQLTKDYTVLTTSREVLQKVIENQELNISYKALKSCITLDNPTDTRILNVSVTYPDAEKAKAIVDELANVASSYIGDKMEVIPPKIIEDGEIPTVQTSPSMSKNTMLGLLAGLILSAGIVVVITIMNDSIKTEDDIEKYLGISTLAVVPDRKDYIGKKKKSKKKKSSKGGRA